MLLLYLRIKIIISITIILDILNRILTVFSDRKHNLTLFNK